MKTKVLFFGCLCLLLCWMLPAEPRKIDDPFIKQDNKSFPLNMAENSVDDMYSTCATKMEAKVKDIFFKKEMKNKLFKNAWTQAEKCAKKSINQTETGDEALTKDQRQAICVYTAGGQANFYKTFNEAVRTNRAVYGSSFQFHSLHFWLTRAIQILNGNQSCETTFRRTTANFTVNINKEIRFGMFTSTSKLSNLKHFGHTTCFEVRTCHGAYLKKYPKLEDREQEVLIPPYEKFKIIDQDKRNGLADCETVYVLKSVGIKSNLNCTIANQILW